MPKSRTVWPRAAAFGRTLYRGSVRVGKAAASYAASRAATSAGSYVAQRIKNAIDTRIPSNWSSIHPTTSKSSTKTSGRRVTRLARRQQSWTASYAGKVKKFRRVTKGIRYKLDTQGSSGTIQYAGTTTSSKTLYIGHCTSPASELLNHVSRALIKAIFNKAGIYIGDWSDTVVGSVPFGTQINIAYRLNPDPGTSLAFAVYTTGAGSTFDAIVTAFNGMWYQLESNSFLERVTLTPPNGITYGFNLTTARIQIYGSSTLTIQNKSLSLSSSASTDIVDRQILVGRGYQGPGTGTRHASYQSANQTTPFVADTKYGVIDKVALASSVAEPPDPYMFSNCYKTTGLYLDPGNVKVSKLSFKKTMLLQSLLRQALDWHTVSPPGNTYQQTSIGKYRFYGLEKLISVPETSPSTTIGWEHNLKIGARLFYGRTQLAAPTFSSNFKP